MLDNDRIVFEQRTSEETSGSITHKLHYIYTHSGLVGFTYNETPYYYLKNVFGDVTAVYDSNNALVAKYVYDAWGNHKIFNSAGTLIGSTAGAVSGYTDHIGNLNPFRYRGYFFSVLMLTVLCKIDLHEVKETSTPRQASTTCKHATTILPHLLTMLTKYLRRSAKRE